jgi:hypothetical protein
LGAIDVPGEPKKKYMQMILTALPGGSTALALSGVMAVVVIRTARSLFREEAEEANAPLTETPPS